MDDTYFDNAMKDSIRNLKFVIDDSIQYPSLPIFVILTKKDIFKELFDLKKFKETFEEFV